MRLRTLLVLAALAAACSKSPDPAATQSAPLSAPGGGPGMRAAHLLAVDAAPPGAAVVATLDVGSVLDGFLSGGPLPTTRDASAFRRAIGEASRKDFGIDLFAARSLSLWVVIESKAVALVVEGPFDGALAFAGAEAADLGGHPGLKLGEVGAALVGGKLVVGTPGAFALLGSKDAAGTDLRARHKEVLGSVADGGVQVSVVVPEALAATLPVKGLEAAALSASSSLSLAVAVKGEAAALDALAAQVTTLRGEVLGHLRSAASGLRTEAFPGASIMAVITDATLADLEAFQWTTRPAPGLLTGATPGLFPQGASGAASTAAFIIPAMAAVAIPAFTRYMDRAKEAETLRARHLVPE